MIQDIAPHRLRNEYDPAARPAPDSPVLCFDGSLLLTAEDGSIPTAALLPGAPLTFLFRLDDRAFFLGQPPGELPEGFAWQDCRELRRQGLLPKQLMFAVMTGKHLADWYRDTVFCGRCGARSAHSDTERAMKCPACGYTAYPRIMPAVIVGVKHNGKLLLTRYRRGVGYYAMIAGFTEIGETAEETVAREVMEEAGVRVKNIRYYGSQPWGIANDLLLGFFCELDGDDETIHMDENELKFASFIPREEIVLQPDEFSLTNEMMMRFRSGEEP